VLAEKFNRMATDVARQFPEELSRLTVVFGKTLAYLSPSLAAEMADKNYHALKRNAVAEKISADIGQITHDLADEPDIVGLARKGDAIGDILHIDVIALKKSTDPGQTPQEKEMELVWRFDHEIGHQIVKNGFGDFSANLRESAADAYAAFMHIRRYGPDTNFLKSHINGVEMFLMLLPEPEEHYTAFTITRAREAAAEMGDRLSRLEPREIAALAAKTASASAPDDESFKKMWTAYQPVQALFESAQTSGEVSGEELCQLIFSVMDQHRDEPATLKAGALFLTSGEDMKKLADKTNPGWQEKFGLTSPTPSPSPKAKMPLQAPVFSL